ncbi:MAG TPA: AAA family ATPase [Pirellulales bacterium]|jgi:aminoglycoside phosphotransferase family enzyme/predicted kinase|nr:AAA family ATPase [Pirellulales bacterium]
MPFTQPLAADENDPLGRFLASPESYPEPTTDVQRLETHISRVLLTDRFVYKLKKPIRFDFLDFSTVEQRHQACVAEFELNRRLAGDVYLSVLPITRSAKGDLAIAGEGEPIDWLVKMRRLNAADTLLAAIRQGTITAGDVDALAGRLAEFYRDQPRLPLSADDYRGQIERHLRANLAELLSDERLFPPHEVRRIHAAQLVFLALHSEEFDARIAGGRVVDGHGDLRPEHVYLTSPPVVIDCVEFNAEFRHVDVLDELSFLESECTRLQAAETGAAIREKCLALSSDRASGELAAFYKSYRACVRAKVALLRAKQSAPAAAREQLALAAQYLDLADRFDELLGPPILLVVRGTSGTGKSTIARALTDRLGIELLQTDAVRQELVGKGKLPADPPSAKYRADHRQQVYDQMLSQAEKLLEQHASVILDGTFLSHADLARVAALADRSRARWLIVHCHCPPEIAKQRIAARSERGRTLSEARPELVEEQVVADVQAHPEWPILRCDTTRVTPTLVEEIVARLREV